MPPIQKDQKAPPSKDGKAVVTTPDKKALPKNDEPKPKPLIPPEDAFWERYSPNSEFPFSSLGSFLLHGTLLFVMLAGAIFFSSDSDTGEEIEPVIVGDGDGPPGGGGNPLGTGLVNPGNLSQPDVKADLLNPDEKPPDPNLLKKDEDLNVVKPGAVALQDDPDADKIIEKAKQKMPSAVNIGPQIKNALTGLAGWGRGGPGSGGGEGSGRGMAKGSGHGGNKRGRRVERWAMIVETTSGQDYVRKMHAIGAYLGYFDKSGRFFLIKELKAPAKPVSEDIQKVGRVWWTDERLDATVPVGQSLQIDTPPMLMWFFPVELENQLVKIELDFAKRYNRNSEEEIGETVFHLAFRGGKPIVTVQSQEGRRK